VYPKLLYEAVPVMTSVCVAGYAIAADPVGARGAGPPRITGEGISVSSIGGTVVATVTVVVTASLESLLKPRTPNMMISVIAVRTAMRLRSKTDRTT
jgi:hypothetical protein